MLTFAFHLHLHIMTFNLITNPSVCTDAQDIFRVNVMGNFSVSNIHKNRDVQKDL